MKTLTITSHFDINKVLILKWCFRFVEGIWCCMRHTILFKGCFVKQYSYKTNSETFDSYDNENVNNNDGQKQNEANDEVSMSLSDLWVLQATR